MLQLKEMLETAAGVPADQQRLVIAGMHQSDDMDNAQPLRAYECVLREVWPWNKQKEMIVCPDALFEDHKAKLLGQPASPDSLARRMHFLMECEGTCEDDVRALIANSGTDINAT